MKRKVKWLKEIMEEYVIAFEDGNMLVAKHPLGEIIFEIPGSKLKWLGKEIEIEAGNKHHVMHGDMSSSFFSWPEEMLEPLPKDQMLYAYEWIKTLRIGPNETAVHVKGDVFFNTSSGLLITEYIKRAPKWDKELK